MFVEERSDLEALVNVKDISFPRVYNCDRKKKLTQEQLDTSQTFCLDQSFIDYAKKERKRR